ncbi:hypothetical protein T03_10566 [Trichinella britovi]|uniref:Uncharacterized protein n=1 Tax=Trichinella britovi TaxID=45882 RepID=A0A0V1AIX4_TRIBR|nr:hypothetical protein T03_10566 [Trichinella britovi]
MNHFISLAESSMIAQNYVVFAKTASVCVIFFGSLQCTPPVLVFSHNVIQTLLYGQ